MAVQLLDGYTAYASPEIIAADRASFDGTTESITLTVTLTFTYSWSWTIPK